MSENPFPSMGAPAWQPPEIKDQEKFEEAQKKIRRGLREKWGYIAPAGQVRRIALGDPSEKGRIQSRIKTLALRKQEFEEKTGEAKLTGQWNTGQRDDAGKIIYKATLEGRRLTMEEREQVGDQTGLYTLDSGFLTADKLGLDFSRWQNEDGSWTNPFVAREALSMARDQLAQTHPGLNLSNAQLRQLAAGEPLGEMVVPTTTMASLNIERGRLALGTRELDIQESQNAITNALAIAEQTGELRISDRNSPFYGQSVETLRSRQLQLQAAQVSGYLEDGSPTLELRLAKMDDKRARDMVFGYDKEIRDPVTGAVTYEHVMGTNELQWVMQNDADRFALFMREGGRYVDSETGDEMMLRGEYSFREDMAWTEAEIEVYQREGGSWSVRRTDEDGNEYWDVLEVRGSDWQESNEARLNRIFEWRVLDDQQRHELVTLATRLENEAKLKYGEWAVDSRGEIYWKAGSLMSEADVAEHASRLRMDEGEFKMELDNRMAQRNLIRQYWLASREWEHEDAAAEAERQWRTVEEGLDRQLQLDLQEGRLRFQRGSEDRAADRAMWAGITSFSMETVDSLLDAWAQDKWNPFDYSGGDPLSREAMQFLKDNGDITDLEFKEIEEMTNNFDVGLEALGGDAVAGLDDMAAASEGAEEAAAPAALAAKLGPFATAANTAVHWAGPAAAATYLSYRAWGKFRDAAQMGRDWNDITEMQAEGARDAGIANLNTLFQGMNRNDANRFRTILEKHHSRDVFDEDGNIIDVDWLDGTDVGDALEAALKEFMGPKWNEFKADHDAWSIATVLTNNWAQGPLKEYHRDVYDNIADIRGLLDSGVFKNADNIKGADSHRVFVAWSKLPQEATSFPLGQDPPDDVEGVKQMLQDLSNYVVQAGIMSTEEMAEQYQGAYPRIIEADSWEGLTLSDQNLLRSLWEQATSNRSIPGGGFGDMTAQEWQAQGGRPGEDPQSNENMLKMFQNRHAPDASGTYYVMPPDLAKVISPDGPYGQGVAENRDDLLAQVASAQGSMTMTPSSNVMRLLDMIPEDKGNRVLRALVTPEDAILPHELEEMFGDSSEDSPARQLFSTIAEEAGMDIFDSWEDLNVYGSDTFGFGE